MYDYVSTGLDDLSFSHCAIRILASFLGGAVINNIGHVPAVPLQLCEYIAGG
jgi:hypothetical protein